MNDDLVKQLRDDNDNRHGGTVLLTGLAADRIEELEAKLQNQTSLIEQFFALLDITEQTDEGRPFKPNRIYSSRVMDAEKLEKVLAGLKRTLEDRG